MKIIAHIKTDFPTKFGVPRQSGLVPELKATIVFEPEYRIEKAFEGLSGFSHIWLLWEFSEAIRENWTPSVRPPRLGGNQSIGVFSTRSPFRPNPIGLSCVVLERIEYHKSLGPILHVAGADLMNDTPIYDIKPYLPYADCHPEATGGFTDVKEKGTLSVHIPDEYASVMPDNLLSALRGVLALDPRPAYQSEATRIYGISFGGFEIKFYVENRILTVCDIVN